MSEKDICLLIVENSREKQYSLKNYSHPGTITLHAASYEKAYNILLDKSIHIILCNKALSDKACYHFLANLSVKYPETLRMVVSEEKEISSAMKAINQGLIYSYIPKPFSHEEIGIAITNAIDFQLLKNRNDKLIADLASMAIRLKKRTEELETQLVENEDLLKDVRASEAALNLKERFSSSLIQNMPDGITVSDSTGKLIRVNPALCKMTGFSEDELIGRKAPHPFWPEEIHKLIMKSFRNLPLGETREVETIFKRRNESRFPVLINPSLIKNEKGNIINYVATVKDISEIKKSQEILRENAELSKHYKRLINSIDGVLWEATLPDFKTVFISQQTEKLLGYTAKEWMKNKNFWKEHIHRDDREEADHYSTEMSLKGKSHTLEYRFLKKNGDIVWLRDIVNVEVLNGVPSRLRGVFVDITIQKQSQTRIVKLNEELEKKVVQRTKRLNAALIAKKESEILYRSMFVNNHAVMLLINPDNSRIVDANPAACKYYGYVHEEICQLTISDINVSPKQEVIATIHDVLRLETTQFETKHKLANGEIRDVEVYSGPIFIGKNLLFSIIHDITSRIKAQEEIERNIQTKEVLLKEVNHRVKNNLAALIGILHIEQDRLQKTGNPSYLNLLTDLTSRIQGLLTVHQLFSLRNWQPIEISQLCERIIKSAFSGMTLTTKLDLHIKPSDILVSSRIAHHLTLIINELATNSLKHALSGRKSVRIAVNISHTGRKVKIKYEDDGPGYPKEFLVGDFRQSNIGFELIRGIIDQSLEGSLKLQNKAGAVAIISFENQSD